MMKKRVREGSALFLALLLVCSIITLQRVDAANAVDITARCSVEFTLAGGTYEELNSIDIPVRLYRVASIDESGKYTALAGFESVDVSSLESDTASADAWLARAAAAADLITDATPAAASTTIKNGKGSLPDTIDTGLYLVVAESVNSDNYTYSFTPYLISLPNNYYASTGNDDWIYDLTGENALSLKPEQTQRLGSLVINKNLIEHHVTMGENATFVFQIDITTPDGKTTTELKTMTFDGSTDSKSVTVGDIPAGSTVTVTEIYSGAGYTLTADSQGPQSVTIIADESAEVTFTNEHDGTITGGIGVDNHYTLDENGQYDVEQLENSASSVQVQ